jgi:hypothetical protein
MRRLAIVVALVLPSGCEGFITDAGETERNPDPPPPRVTEGWVPHADPGLRLLTRFEYDNTVRDLLGVDLELAAERFPADVSNAVGFDNGHAWSVSELHVERHLEVAEAVAGRAVAERWDALLPCGREGADGCMDALLESLLPRAFRRPVSEEEHAVFSAMAAETADLGFETSVELVLTAILASPQFLYQLEPADGDPGDVVALDGPERASRLSYFLWGSMPDEALFDAALAGELDDPSAVEAHARRMLDDPRAAQAVDMFHRRWLSLDLLEQMEKDEALYPELDSARAGELSASMRAFLADAFDGGLAVLTTSNSTWLTPELAAIYGVDASDAPAGELTRYELDASRRAGLLTQPALLSMLAHADQHSPILRGVFLREQILCAELPDPPPGIAVAPPPPDPNATTRERFTRLTSDPTCSACHGLINPAGFLFEHYDALGRFRADENDRAIDASGELVGIDDPALTGPIDDAVDLGERLAGSVRFERCLSRQWVRWALRGPDAPGDEVLVDQAVASLDASGGDFRELLLALATSDAMRFRRIPGRE